MQNFLTCFFLTCIFFSFGQTRFVLRAQTEPNGIQKIKELPNQDIITLVKHKGNQLNHGIYVVEKLSKDFEMIWDNELLVNRTENIVNWEVQGNQVVIFTTEYLTEDKLSILTKNTFDFEKGTFLKKDTVFSRKIEPWHNEFGKAKIYQTFDNAIASVSPPTYLTPLEYQNKIVFSPNRKMTLVYHYIFSEKELYAHGIVYNEKFEKIGEGKIPIDLNFTSYPMIINNRGDVILTKVTTSGKVALIQYDLKTKENKYISLVASNSTRDNLKVHLINDDEGYLGTLTKKNGQLTGLTCSKFSFKEEKIIDNVFYLFDVEFQNEIRKAQKEKHIKEDHNLYNFRLVNFDVDEKENIYFTAEQQWLIGEEISYEDNTYEKIENWAFFPARVNTNTAIIWALDSNLDEKWRYFVVKKQSTGAIDGTNTTSIFTAHTPKKTQILYALSPKQILFNQIHHIEIDNETGKEVINENLENPLKLSLSRVYCFLNKNNEVVWVGRKGLVGKKTFIQKIKK